MIAAPAHPGPDMHLFFDLAPLLAFLVAFKLGGIYTATAVLMIAMAVLVGATWLRTRQVSALQLGSAVLVWVFGALTLILRDTRFLHWKPTLFLWAVALAAAVSFRPGSTPMAQKLMQPALGEQMSLQRGQWLHLTLAWTLFCAALGAVNLFVAFNLSEATWVNFKVFGIPVATFLFVLGQTAWLVKAARPGDQAGFPTV